MGYHNYERLRKCQPNLYKEGTVMLLDKSEIATEYNCQCGNCTGGNTFLCLECQLLRYQCERMIDTNLSICGECFDHIFKDEPQATLYKIFDIIQSWEKSLDIKRDKPAALQKRLAFIFLVLGTQMNFLRDENSSLKHSIEFEKSRASLGFDFAARSFDVFNLHLKLLAKDKFASKIRQSRIEHILEMVEFQATELEKLASGKDFK